MIFKWYYLLVSEIYKDDQAESLVSNTFIYWKSRSLKARMMTFMSKTSRWLSSSWSLRPAIPRRYLTRWALKCSKNSIIWKTMISMFLSKRVSKYINILYLTGFLCRLSMSYIVSTLNGDDEVYRKYIDNDFFWDIIDKCVYQPLDYVTEEEKAEIKKVCNSIIKVPLIFTLCLSSCIKFS